jgi:hypothetical protein
LAVGEENEEHLRREADGADLVVCAWGDNCEAVPRRDIDVLGMLTAYDLLCIRRTAKGNPAHPVRERYTEKPEAFCSKDISVRGIVGKRE